MTQADERDTIWLTQDAFDKKQAELEEMRTTLRTDIVARIAAAREEGDLKENGGYHAAREELSKLDGRIAQVEQMLRKAQVGEAADDGTVSPGSKVTYRGPAGERTFLLGAREIAEGSDDDIEVYSPQSPLGSALIGHKVGDKVSYTAPNGKDITVEIIASHPYTG